LTANTAIQPINRTAKIIALVFGVLHISIYLFLAAVLFFPGKLLDRLLDHSDGIAFVTYGSFIISLSAACMFTIVPGQKKMPLILSYTAFFVFNILTLLIYLGLSHIGDNGWLH
jgi:hypothetical protein